MLSILDAFVFLYHHRAHEETSYNMSKEGATKERTIMQLLPLVYQKNNLGFDWRLRCRVR